MASDPDPAAAHQFILQAYTYYAALMKSEPAESGEAAPQGLAGQLFWVGELDAPGCALTVAANVAGAATLAASGDLDAQRSAMRDGVVDFLVNSLDEALRILKNEIRKRETAAVCVAATLEAVEREMVERGVRPDVLREGVVRAAEKERASGRASRTESDSMSAPAVVSWSVDRAPAVWLPKMDAIALECLAPHEAVARRWVMRSNRYLGKLGRTEHLVLSDREFAARFMERFEELRQAGEMKAGGRIEMASSIGTDTCTFEAMDEGEDALQS